jgi:hypothetical protein
MIFIFVITIYEASNLFGVDFMIFMLIITVLASNLVSIELVL